MTLGGWIVFAIFAAGFFGLAICISITHNLKKRGYIIAVMIAAILSILLLVLMMWWYGNTESGKRAMKTQESNFNSGIERVVKVYDMNGGLIAEYSGKFDVDYDNDRIIFDDENGKRHIIYYPTGTVIIDEE